MQRTLDMAQLIVYILLACAILWVSAHAVAVLDGIEKRQQQSDLKHDAMLEQAYKGLKDHEAFFVDHQTLMRQLAR